MAGAPPKHMAKRSATAQRTDPPGYQLLLRRLAGVRRARLPRPAWFSICPCHDDDRPSLLIEYKRNRYGELTLLGYCRSCQSNLQDVCEAVGVAVHRVLSNNATLGREIGQPVSRFVAPLPRPADVAAWQERLSSDPRALGYLRQRRGLTSVTVRRHGIGYDGARYILPIYEQGRLVNVRRYDPRLAKGRMRGLAGRSARVLYPGLPASGWVLVCEGEWDALIARQHQLPAVTSLGGVGTWDEQWNGLLRDREVAIAYDCDAAGRAASVRRAEGLVGTARAVKVVDLGLGEHEDLTDWFVKYQRTTDDLLQLIKRTKVQR